MKKNIGITSILFALFMVSVSILGIFPKTAFAVEDNSACTSIGGRCITGQTGREGRDCQDKTGKIQGNLCVGAPDRQCCVPNTTDDDEDDGGGGDGGDGGGIRLENPLAADSFEGFIVKLINSLIIFSGPILALVVAIGGFKFVLAGANPKQKEDGMKMIKYGVIGFIIMLSAWILVAILKSLF